MQTGFIIVLSTLVVSAACGAQQQGKESSAFYPAELVEKARANAAKYPWAAAARKQAVEAAKPWMKLSNAELWDLMFGNTIKRSWMVWSDGHCPACKEDVPMYTWVVDAVKVPWKVRCPHCRELFPKNDFHAFYRSGLDDHGIFDPKLADRSLLYNTDHPDPADPLYKFGVDDGDGYAEGEKLWRFTGAYLIYGQWRQMVLGGIQKLAAAYVLTGDRRYAHKAAVLLDRVADLYPTFDFKREGTTYEGRGHQGSGYVTVWHDARFDTHELILAYDQIFEGIQRDEILLNFLAGRARKFKLDNPKRSMGDLQRNIEERIFLDVVQNRPKIESNAPQTDIVFTLIKTVLGWPGNRNEVHVLLDSWLEKATAVDGMTGEKGLAGYTAYPAQAVAVLLAHYARLDPDFLKEILKRHPALHDMYRFHIDTWCLGQYYPASGDDGAFAGKRQEYAGARFSRSAGISPSMFTLFWQLYELTGDAGFVQVLYHANGGSVEGLPHDLFAADPPAFQRLVMQVIRRQGAAPKVGSVNKEEWHLAILRSGAGADARALWLDYDAGQRHGHFDGMNLGLYAWGLDLMPDFGYPPVNYGGWDTPQVRWYGMSAAHNTVVVDGRNHREAAGRTTLWAAGKYFHAVRASGPDLTGEKQFERTVAMIDLSDRDFYIIDLFRVAGGTEHAKFMHSSFSKITTQGLALKPAEDYGRGTIMRNFSTDPATEPGWAVDWKIEDRYKLLPPGTDVRLRYTDLTEGAQAFTAEGWIDEGTYQENRETWIPRVMIRRRSKEPPLVSAFVGLIEPYVKLSGIKEVSRLSLQTGAGATYPESNVALQINLTTGEQDFIAAADVENPLLLSPSFTEHKSLFQKDWDLRLDGEMCLVRRDRGGQVRRIALCRGSKIEVGNTMLKLKNYSEFIEVSLEQDAPLVVSGNPDDIEDIIVNGRGKWKVESL